MSKNTSSNDGYEPKYAAAQYELKATAQVIAQAKWPALSADLSNSKEWTNQTVTIFKRAGAMMLLLSAWTPVPLNELHDFLRGKAQRASSAVSRDIPLA